MIVSPEYFYRDLDLFGHAFENFVLRDLLAYAQAHDAKLMHYCDDNGLEIDAVFQMQDGRYALIEIKTGVNAVPQAEANLLKFREVIRAHNVKAKLNKAHPGVVYLEPSVLVVVCANAPFSYTTENGVHVIPFSCLRD